MLYKEAMSIGPIVEVNEINKNMLIKQASKFCNVNDFPQRYQQLFHNYIVAQNIANLNSSGSQRVGSYNPEFKYYRCIALHANIPNQNADYWAWGNLENPDEPELLRFEKEANRMVYESFRGRGSFVNHDNDDVTKAVGIILDVAPNHDGKFIEALIAVDTKKNPSLVRDIDNGIVSAVSMGCICGYSLCSICENKAHNEKQYCEHLRTKKGQTIYHNGEYKKVYEDNHDVNFVELSWVNVPADPDAKLLERVANKSINLSFENDTIKNAFTTMLNDHELISMDDITNHVEFLKQIKSTIEDKLNKYGK